MVFVVCIAVAHFPSVLFLGMNGARCIIGDSSAAALGWLLLMKLPFLGDA